MYKDIMEYLYISYDLTTFQIPGQKFSNFFVGSRSSWSRGSVPSSHARGQARFDSDACSISNHCLTQEIFTPTPADCCPSISLKQCFGQ